MIQAPAGFKTAVAAAVQFFDTTFTDNIGVNIDFGWGEVGGQTIGSGSVGESVSEYLGVFTYQQVRNALIVADTGSGAIAQAVAALPTVDPSGGATFLISDAEQKALGLYLGRSSGVDGYVGLSQTLAYTFDPNNRAVRGAYDAIGVLEHEISEVLGRSVSTSSSSFIQGLGSVPTDDPLDLFRYTAPGVHTFQPGSAYFSLDGGVTNLKTFNDGSNGGDGGDWAGGNQADSFDASLQAGVQQAISSVDLQEMALLGHTLAPRPVGPTVGPGIGGSPTTGNGTLNGTSGDDWLLGGPGNDILHGGPGSDYLDGGGGLNTALYDGAYRQYTVTLASPTTVAGGPEGGTDDLVNIQRIQFVDGYLATSTGDTAAEVYRLYWAALNRAPDSAGLAGWTHALNAGTSLQTVASGFVVSVEFQSTYGALDNTAFITLLYHNVLHRAPDAAGLTSWLNYMAQGHGQADVLVGFSQSAEDISALAAPVQQGLWVQDTAAAETARLYDTVLGRLPDATGLVGWTHDLESGALSLLQVAQDFVASAEFQAAYGALNDSQFVTRLYENALHREPDPAGLASWVSFLSQGHNRSEVVLGFSESPEHIADTAPHIDNGIWLA